MTDTIPHIQDLLEPMLQGTDMFITAIKIKPTNNVKVFIDADSGFSIQKCAQINRALYAAIEEKQLFPDGDFSLEVSSPGIDEPLKTQRQFVKNIGREIEITPTDEAMKPFTGKLTKANESSITIAVTDKKKKEVSEHVIGYDAIKTAVVQISFK